MSIVLFKMALCTLLQWICLSAKQLYVFFNPSNVYLGHLLGAAPVIGMVPSLSAQYYQNCPVAVKTVLEHADETQRAEFLREIAILTKLGFHSHIVNLLGCVTTGQEKYLVMELAEMNLLEYVRSLDKEHPPLRCLLSIAWQVADGMVRSALIFVPFERQ